MRRAFHTFIGVDLGGGKGKTTAVCRLRLGKGDAGEPQVIVEDQGHGSTWYDDQLVDYLLRFAGGAVVAIDAPLSLPVCVRCTLPSCPGAATCDVPTVAWFRRRDAQRQAAGDVSDARGKPRYTPYTQRASEVVLHEDLGITPRETLGQGMGPLTARMAYLRRALADRYQLNNNMLEVYPKASLTQLFPDVPRPHPQPAAKGCAVDNRTRDGHRTNVLYRDSNGHLVGLAEDDEDESPGRGPRSYVARHYKRSGHALPIRARVLDELSNLRFGPGQWREFAVQSDHQFDSLICAYTAFLWARDGWDMPPDRVFADDGWIWVPPTSQQPR